MNEALAGVVKLAGRVRLNAQALKTKRGQLGLSQEGFARVCAERRLCVSIASVKRAETGKSVLLRTARHLAAFHGVPLQELLLSSVDGAAALSDDASNLDDRDTEDGVVGVQTPLRHIKLVGRQQELRLFGTLLQSVVADQQSQVMTVQSMAGMGKSRLLMEMADLAKERFFCTAVFELPRGAHDGHCAAMAACLKALLGLQERTPFWTQLAARSLTYFGLTPKQMLICRDALSVSLQAEEQRLLQAMGDAERQGVMVQAVSAIVIGMASRRPLVVAVEDIHWAAPKTMELLSRVLSATQSSPVMWLFSARLDAPANERRAQRLIPDMGCLSLTLPPLRQSEALTLCQQFPEVSAEWRERCMRHAQGHPQVLIQLLQAQAFHQRSAAAQPAESAEAPWLGATPVRSGPAVCQQRATVKPWSESGVSEAAVFPPLGTLSMS